MRRHTTCTLLCDALQHRTVRQSTLLTMYLCTYTLRERYSLGNAPVLVTLLASLVIVAYFLRFVNAFLESCKKIILRLPTIANRRRNLSFYALHAPSHIHHATCLYPRHSLHASPPLRCIFRHKAVPQSNYSCAFVKLSSFF